eukprot:Phypoly_transcript_06987.p1 GENE.Phypoly_transcript_06987~~Phypoly_transcript_06987.p1  ORF type:complete len:439 (+),score=129.56 Phypoly_transcript_06987:355-1671(+)
MRVCTEWTQAIRKWSDREIMLDLNFRRKLVRSQMKCENEKRWDVLSIGYLTSLHGDDVLKTLNYNSEPPAKTRDDVIAPPKAEEPEKELKVLVPPLCTNLPNDQLQQILALPFLSRSISPAQITQIYIPFVKEDLIFRQLPTLPSLAKLYVFKYQMTDPLEVKSASLRELDLDMEEFDEEGERIYHPLNFSTIECPNLHRLRLSGLALSPLSSSGDSSPSPYAHLFACLDSARMGRLRHLQLELRVDKSGEKGDQKRSEEDEKRDEEKAVAHLRSTSLQRLSVDNYYADYFFNVSQDCPNITSVYLRCLKFTLGPAFDSFCKLAANRHVTLWLDYITLHTPNGHLLRLEETNLHTTIDYKRGTRTLAVARAGLRKLVVNGNTLSRDNMPNEVTIEVDEKGAWVACDGRRSWYERAQGDVRIEMEGEKDGEKGRIVLCK